RRTEAHAQLREALDGDRYLTLLDQLIAAAQAPALLESTADHAATKALPPIVRRACRPLLRKARRFSDEPAAQELHAPPILPRRPDPRHALPLRGRGVCPHAR